MTGGFQRPEAEAGFTLVETLIAMAIVATMTALVFNSISQNARATQMIADRRAAALVAQSALDQTVAGAPERTGEAGNLRWRARVESYPSSGEPSLGLVTVTVVKADSEALLLQLRTLKIAR